MIGMHKAHRDHSQHPLKHRQREHYVGRFLLNLQRARWRRATVAAAIASKHHGGVERAAIGSKPASADRRSSRLPSLYLFLVGPENVVPERGDHSEIALVDAMMHAMVRPSLLQPSEWNLVDPHRMLHMVKRVKVEVAAR
jgi:hypothetical protein